MDNKLDDLDQFYGTENWYRHGVNRKFLYTDGVQYLAENGGAYWLIDEIALANLFQDAVKKEEFQVWNLTKVGQSGKLVCDDGNGTVVYSKNIPFTDFPLDTIKLYASNDGENTVLMLPSEY